MLDLTITLGKYSRKRNCTTQHVSTTTKPRRVVSLVPDREPVMITINLAEAFLLNGDIDSAAYYFKVGLELAENSNHTRGLANALSGLSDINFEKTSIEKA